MEACPPWALCCQVLDEWVLGSGVSHGPSPHDGVGAVPESRKPNTSRTIFQAAERCSLKPDNLPDIVSRVLLGQASFCRALPLASHA